MTNEIKQDQKVSSKPRLLYIDNIRILLTILVILHHLAIGYGASGNNPYVEAGEISTVSTILMTLFVAINQSFFMGFFFMISSYFTPGSYDRKGGWPYVLDRLKRLGIPLLFYIVVIDPLLSYVLSRYYGFPGSLGEFLSIYLKSYDRLGVGPLWFVAALLIFSLVYALLRLAIKPLATPPPSEGKAPSNLAIAGFALALGLLTFVVRIWMPVGREFELLGFQLAHFVQYIAMFIVGIVAYRRNWFSALTVAQAKVWLRVVLLLLVLSQSYSLPQERWRVISTRPLVGFTGSPWPIPSGKNSCAWRWWSRCWSGSAPGSTSRALWLKKCLLPPMLRTFSIDRPSSCWRSP